MTQDLVKRTATMVRMSHLLWVQIIFKIWIVCEAPIALPNVAGTTSSTGANADMRGSALETKNPIRQLSDVGRQLSDVGNAISPRVLSRDAKISKSLKQSLTCDSEQE